MIFDFVIIFIFLTLTGFSIISLLCPSTNIVFKLGCSAYFSSLVIIVSASIFLRMGLNINYCVIPFMLISLIAWCLIYKKTVKNLANFNNRTNLKTILIVGFIICISSSILIYPSIMRAYGIFHMGPDFYGYGMVASYLQEGNTIMHLRQVMENVVKHFGASAWSLGDLRESVSLNFIVDVNRYGVQSLAAVLDNLIFHSNSAVKLLYPLMAISIMAVLSSVYQLIFEYKLKITYAMLAILLVGFNPNNLVAIVEGHIGSVFSLTMPLLVCIAISSFYKPQKHNGRIIWPTIFTVAVLLSSSLISYQEVTGILVIFLVIVTIYAIKAKDKKTILNLIITGIVFFILNFDILLNFILSIYVRFHNQFAGASLSVGFLDFLSAIGFVQPYRIIPHTIVPLGRESNIFVYSTIAIYFTLLLITLLNYKFRKINIITSPVVFLGIFCFSIVVSLSVFNNYFIVWKLTYAFFPFIIISLVLFIVSTQKYFDKIINKYFSHLSLNQFTFVVFPIIVFFISSIVIINYVKLYESYVGNSDFMFNSESKAFEKGIYSNKLLLTMSENQLYYLPGFHGRLYWLNSGWIPVFDNRLRNQEVTLVIFKQLEGEEFFKDANKYFHKNILYSNDMTIIAKLGIPGSVFFTNDNKTNRDYMKSYLNTLRKKIELQS